jgi:hypothetical protein
MIAVCWPDARFWAMEVRPTMDTTAWLAHGRGRTLRGACCGVRASSFPAGGPVSLGGERASRGARPDPPVSAGQPVPERTAAGGLAAGRRGRLWHSGHAAEHRAAGLPRPRGRSRLGGGGPRAHRRQVPAGRLERAGRTLCGSDRGRCGVHRRRAAGGPGVVRCLPGRLGRIAGGGRPVSARAAGRHGHSRHAGAGRTAAADR